MTPEFFSRQMTRLNTQWKNSYGEERTKRLWQIWKNCDESVFADIIDRALDTYRQAPLTDDFAKIEQEVRSQRAKFREYDGLSGQLGIQGVLHGAYKEARFEDEEVRKRVQGRIKAVHDLANGRMTRTQFEQAMGFYDKAASLNPEVVKAGMGK